MLGGNFQIIPILLILQIFRLECTLLPIYPKQVHLSLGNSPSEMVVTWVTFSYTDHSAVWYGKTSEGLIQRADGCYRVFRNFRRVRYVHKVVLPSLEPCEFYVYRCGSFYGVSDVHIFKTNPVGTKWSPRVIIFGDMGWQGAYAFPYVLNDAKDYDVNAVIHVGDIAYDMASCDGIIGDRFMNMIEPLASIVPYMTTVGNHEQYRNFTHYKNIFSMPGKSDGLFYSFNLGPIHFVAISTEVYYFMNYGIEPLLNQYAWLQRDLKSAAHRSNRRKRPWIIVLAHRPMYCSSDDGEDCSLDRSILRCCSYNNCNYGLEDLFHKYGVDLIFSGHMHYYERSWPIYNKQVYSGACGNVYRNAKAAVHIITGAAGMKSGPEIASYIRTDLFAFYTSEPSYSLLTVYNKSVINLQQISVARGGQVIDAACFIKDL